MADPVKFFSVLNELARSARQRMSGAEWQKYLQPGRTLVRGGVKFPLRSDELKYGPFKDVTELLDPSLKHSPEEMYQMLEEMRKDPEVAGRDPQFQTNLPGDVGRAREISEYQAGRPISIPRMSYENQYQLPGPKLGQSEHLTLIPGSDFVAQSGHFGGQPGLLSWSRVTRRPVVTPKVQGTGFRVEHELDPSNARNFTNIEDARAYANQEYPDYVAFPGASADDLIKEHTGELSTGNPTATHLEEIQSDWHQRGAKEGYGRVVNPDEFKVITKPDDQGGFLTHFVTDTHGNVITSSLARNWESPEDYLEFVREMHREGHGETIGVPPAPYKDTYAELELKKGIAHAIANGDDYVTWTTGDQQADRWGQALRNSVDEIQWEKGHNSGLYSLMPMKNGRPVFNVDERFRDLNENQLEDLVGSDVAKRIISGGGKSKPLSTDELDRLIYLNEKQGAVGGYESLSQSEKKDVIDLQRRNDEYTANAGSNIGVISGNNLTVGGSGMRLFYDRKVPAAAQKLAQQYGGEVTKVKLPANNDTSPEVQNSLRTIRQMHPGDLSSSSFTEHLGNIYNGLTHSDELDDILGDLVYAHDNYHNGPDDENEAFDNYNDSVRKLMEHVAKNPGQGSQEVHALRITPEMKKRVLEAGLPLFSTAAATVAGIPTMEGRYAEQGDQPLDQPQGYAKGGIVGGSSLPSSDYFHLPSNPWFDYFGIGRGPTFRSPQPQAPRLPDWQPWMNPPAGTGAAHADLQNQNKTGTDASVTGGNYQPFDLGKLYGFKGISMTPASEVQTPAISGTVPQGSRVEGTPPFYLQALQAAEGGSHPDQPVSGSTALGPFRFTEGTWTDVAKRHPELRLTPDGRTDPIQAQAAAAAFTADNAETLRRLGEPPTDANLRVLHVLGAAGGPRMLYALHTDPDGPALAHAAPDAVAANPSLFYHPGHGGPVSVTEFYQRLTKDFPGSSFAEAYLQPTS